MGSKGKLPVSGKIHPSTQFWNFLRNSLNKFLKHLFVSKKVKVRKIQVVLVPSQSVTALSDVLVVAFQSHR